jgi:putative ATPase
MEAFKFIGPPEGELALVQAAVYLATAPKSNSLYTAYGKVRLVIRESGALPVPLHIRNAPTGLMKALGYGKDYAYAHDFEDAYAPQEYLPEPLKGKRFYIPSERGFEKEINRRLEFWKNLKKKSKKP